MILPIFLLKSKRLFSAFLRQKSKLLESHDEKTKSKWFKNLYIFPCSTDPPIATEKKFSFFKNLVNDIGAFPNNDWESNLPSPVIQINLLDRNDW